MNYVATNLQNARPNGRATIGRERLRRQSGRPIATGAARSRAGFTLIECLVASVLVALAVTGIMGALRYITATQVKAADADLLQRLATEKIADMRYLSDPTLNGTAGDFSDRDYPNITWSADIESTAFNDVDQVTVTVTRGKDSQALTTMMYVPPASGTTTSTSAGSTTGGATGGGG